MRVFVLSTEFKRGQRIYARIGSPEDDALRPVLRRLMHASTLPGPNDEEALRSPYETIWARPVPETDLVVTYSFDPFVLELRSLRPAW